MRWEALRDAFRDAREAHFRRVESEPLYRLGMVLVALLVAAVFALAVTSLGGGVTDDECFTLGDEQLVNCHG